MIVKCKFCKFKSSSYKDLTNHLGGKIRKLKKRLRKKEKEDIIKNFVLPILIAVMASFIYAHITEVPPPELTLNVTRLNENIAPRTLYHNVVVWREGYKVYDLYLTNRKTDAFEVSANLIFNDSVFYIEPKLSLFAECKIEDRGVTYVYGDSFPQKNGKPDWTNIPFIQGTRKTLNFTDEKIVQVYGHNDLFIYCDKIGSTGFYSARVYTNSGTPTGEPDINYPWLFAKYRSGKGSLLDVYGKIFIQE